MRTVSSLTIRTGGGTSPGSQAARPALVSGAASLAGRARSRSAQLPPGHRHHSESPVASRLAAVASPGTQPTRALEYLRDRCPPRNLVGRLGRGLDPNAPAVDPWGRS
jgi:hypothetical protein